MRRASKVINEVTAIKRLSMEQKRLCELFFLGDRLVGCMMIGEVMGRKKLLQIIKDGVDVEDKEALLHLE